MARREDESGDGAIGATADALYALMSDFVRQIPRDISMTAVSTLAMLRSRGPQRVTTLAGAQGVAQPTMTAMISTLERAGLVVRRHDPDDRRATLVELTDAGEAYVVDRKRRNIARIADYLTGLPEEHMSALVAALPALHRLDALARHRVS
ncbi:MarR family transcriptional regulator [Gordonia sp. OPL2]|nr:MarR family transcriptional regulator [Gordonia sp. OPL2]